MDRKVVLSTESKEKYLSALIGKMLKILHLIEEEKQTGFSPKQFIENQLFELNSANELFGGELVSIIVKLNGILDGYADMPFDSVKKQIFEIKKMINFELRKIAEG